MPAKNPKLSGILFILGGAAFYAAYLASRQVSFIGVGVAFLLIGVSLIVRSRQKPEA